MSEEVPKVESGQDQNDEWIVQSKPRRLVPQHSLSKQDLDSDKNKTAAASGDAKKKVTRFTKEEMMTFRQPVNILGFMADMTDVISTERLNPVCFERFEPEDVIRIWNTDKTGPGGKGGEGRGRGRGKPGFKPDEAQGEQMPSEWNNTREPGNNNKGGLWDDATGADGTGADGLDLEDFAAMALKFRSEMEQMKLNGEGGEAAAKMEDPMTALVGEQVRRLGGFEVEEDEPLPDWAADIAAQAVAPQPAAKRSLLLDTLNVKPQTAAAVVSHTTTTTSSLGGALDLNVTQSVHTSSVLSAPLPPRVEPSEWLYTDPQGQVQGPFEQESMRQWHEAGYFNADLPIKLRQWQRFHTFQVVFPDFKLAFLTIPQEPGSLLLSVQQQQHAQQQALLRQQQQQIEEQRQKLEQEQRQLELQRQQEQQRQLELQRQQQEQQRQLELQRQQQEQQRQKELALQQQQAEQLLLQQQQAAAAEQERQRALAEQERQQAAAATPVSPAKPATVAPWANKQPEPKRGTTGESLTAIQNAEQAARDEERRKQAVEQAKVSKGWTTTSSAATPALSLAEIQQQEKEARQRQQAEAAKSSPASAPATTSMSSQLKNLLGVKTAAAPAPVSSGPAWGGSATAAPASKGSLRDIMKEETSGRPEAESNTGARSAGAVAKPMSWASKAGSSTFTAVPEPVPVAPKVVQRAVPPPAPVAVVPAAVRPSAKPAAAVSAKESFGGKEMSKDMADWCTVQLKRLNGSDDLTLVQFCMSLDSAVEIRQYLSEYLGSSPAVTNFATDFIKYREGGRKAIDSGSLLSSAGAADATRASSANTNNPSGFVNAGKKKRGGK